MRKLKQIFVICAAVCVCFLFSGCWDVIELDEIFIATAIAIDFGENPEEYEITVEVAKTGNATSSVSEHGEQSEKSTIIFKETSKSLAKAFEILNFDSSRSIILEQVQIILISKEVAEQGIARFLDFLLRARQPRIEMKLIVADGKASELLEISPEQEQTSSSYIIGLLKEVKSISDVYETRVVDFINQLLDKSSSSVLPLLSKTFTNDEDRIKLEGFAFFKDGKLVGTRSDDESAGYLFTKGNVQEKIMVAESEEGLIAYRVKKSKVIENLEYKNGKLAVSYKVYPAVVMSEIIGFDQYTFLEFLEIFKTMTCNQIEDIIIENIDYSKSIGVDSLSYLTKLYKKNPKIWKEINENWEEIFSNMEVKVEVKMAVPSSGKSAESIDMEIYRKNDR